MSVRVKAHYNEFCPTKHLNFLADKTSPAVFNMARNHTETSHTSTTSARSVIHCPQIPNFALDLNETTIHWILFPITLITSLATIILNALAILAVKQKRELKKPSNILLSSMAIADLLVGATSMPLTVATDIMIIRQVSYSGFCALHFATEVLFTFIWSCLYHLTLIAWERNVAIRKWIDYKVIVTTGRMKKVAIVAWLLAVITTFPPMIMTVAGAGQNIKEAWFIGGSVVAMGCLIIIGYFYIMVYLGVRKRKINEISNVSTLIKAKLESRVAMTCGLITAALILSFVPVIVDGALGEVFPVLRTRKAFRVTDTLLQLNSVANPLIYFYRDRRFRNAALELLGVKRPEAIQPAARFFRRKDPFASLENVPELQKDEQHTRLKRAASCDTALVSYCVYQRSHEMILKRSMSAPTLNKYSGSEDGLQLHQTSPMVRTTSMIHTESGSRYQAKTSNTELPQNTVERKDTNHLVSRSKSWDASASVKCSNRTCQMLEEAAVGRPTTAPLLHSERNCSAKLTRESVFDTRF